MGTDRAARTIGLGAALAATLLVSACGAGATTATTPTTAAAQGGAAAATPAPAAPTATTAAPGSAQLTALTRPPAGFPPREAYTEEGEEQGNDGPMAKIPQGLPKAQAVAAGLGTDGIPIVMITGTETDCFANTATVAAGPTWFVLENRGQVVNELYLVKDDEEIIEVENLENGQAGAFKYTVTADAKWIVACEPGQADKQVRFPLTVTG